MASEKTFSLPDDIMENACRSAAALFLARNPPISPETGLTPSNLPGLEERNGTITFVERCNRLFGITAWHVVEALRDDPRLYGFMTRVGPPAEILDRFIRCQDPAGLDTLDLAQLEQLRA